MGLTCRSEPRTRLAQFSARVGFFMWREGAASAPLHGTRRILRLPVALLPRMRPSALHGRSGRARLSRERCCCTTRDRRVARGRAMAPDAAGSSLGKAGLGTGAIGPSEQNDRRQANCDPASEPLGAGDGRLQPARAHVLDRAGLCGSHPCPPDPGSLQSAAAATGRARRNAGRANAPSTTARPESAPPSSPAARKPSSSATTSTWTTSRGSGRPSTFWATSVAGRCWITAAAPATGG